MAEWRDGCFTYDFCLGPPSSLTVFITAVKSKLFTEKTNVSHILSE